MVIFDINNIIIICSHKKKREREYSTEYALLQNKFCFPQPKKKKKNHKKKEKKRDLKS